ncbi:MAG: hypothetical protein MZV64_50535 [Ignavibacteriales bacterium]|nr:hypothetical protein [Ignavibacteriales bacterium]
MMMPKDGMMVCRKVRPQDTEGLQANPWSARPSSSIAWCPSWSRSPSGLPTTNARCPECGNNVAYWWLRQLRSADESEVRFFRCTKCSRTWREYD